MYILSNKYTYMETNLTKWLKENDNPSPPKDKPDKKEIESLYLSGLGSWKLAKHYNVSQKLALEWLHYYDIKIRTKSQSAKFSLNGYKQGKKNLNWRGNKVSYPALHSWIRKYKGTPQKCEHCGRTDKKKYEWASINHSYTRNLDDWIRLCTKCHKEYDK